MAFIFIYLFILYNFGKRLGNKIEGYDFHYAEYNLNRNLHYNDRLERTAVQSHKSYRSKAKVKYKSHKDECADYSFESKLLFMKKEAI